MNHNSIVEMLELEFPEVFVNQKADLSSTTIFQSKFFRVWCKEGIYGVNPQPSNLNLVVSRDNNCAGKSMRSED